MTQMKARKREVKLMLKRINGKCGGGGAIF